MSRFFAVLTAAVMAAVPVTVADGTMGTLDRIRATGRITLGYRLDARPFSYGDASGQPGGYAVALCHHVAAAVRTAIAPELTVRWTTVTREGRFEAVRRGDIDLLCSADSITLTRRGMVTFSIPIFPGGIGAMVRLDAPLRLRQVLAGRGQTWPNWRASAGRTLQARALTAVAGTTGQTWLASRVRDFHILAERVTVNSYQEGVELLLSRRSDVLFGERAILLDAVKEDRASRKLAVVERQFTSEPLALALARGEEDCGLFVDGVLSRLYRSGEAANLYASAFGEPDESALAFFRSTALVE
jgi:polar amino acid transport system substrate-binding protein